MNWTEPITFNLKSSNFANQDILIIEANKFKEKYGLTVNVKGRIPLAAVYALPIKYFENPAFITALNYFEQKLELVWNGEEGIFSFKKINGVEYVLVKKEINEMYHSVVKHAFASFYDAYEKTK